MARLVYTPEQIDFLRAGIDLTLAQLTEAFNARFCEHKSAKVICSTCKNHKIHRVRKGPGKGNGQSRIYTPEQMQFIRDNYSDRSVVELTAIFNERFGTDRTRQQIKSFVHNRGITSGRTGQFEKGQNSWNKGIKGYMGANATSFKKGNAPANRRDLYSERVDSKDGFVLIKVPERNPHTGFATRFKHKHVWVWEQENGPVPKGQAVVFRDSDKLNCDLDNLMLTSRAELLHLNLHHYKEAPAELKPTIIALAKLEVKAGIRSTGRADGAGRKRKEWPL